MRLLWLPILLILPGEASAGAWTRAVEEGFSAQSVRYFQTDRRDGGRFRQAAFNGYFEYGLREGFTIGAEIEQGFQVSSDGTQEQSGRIAGFARARLWTGEGGDVVSAQLGVASPLSGRRFAGQADDEDGIEIEARGLWGRGFSSDWGGGWLGAELGYTHFRGPRGDALRLDLTAGLRPDDDWIVIGQMFGTLSVTGVDRFGPEFSAAKLKLSAGRKVWEDRTLLLGVQREVWTRGITPGWELSISFWAPF